MAEMWFNDRCPKCKEKNWAYNGTSEDFMYPDTEALKCWSCGHAWWLGEINESENPDSTPEECADEGLKTPS